MSVLHEAILKQAPVSAKQLDPGLPPSLEQSINKALEKARGPRYQSAAQMRGDLMSIPHPRQATTPKPRIWKLAAALTSPGSCDRCKRLDYRTFDSVSRRAPNPATSSNMRIIPLTDLPGTSL